MSKEQHTIFGQKCVIHDKQTQKILILERSKTDPSEPFLWDFVGGGVNFLENNKESIKRESIEEAGIILNKIKLIDLYSKKTIKENTQFICGIWFCDDFEYLNENNQVQLSYEHSEYKWIPLSQITQYQFASAIQNSIDHIIRYIIKHEKFLEKPHMCQ